MMSDKDHEVFADLLDQGAVSASDEVLASCVLEALRPYGLHFQQNSFATHFHSTEYRVDRFLDQREPLEQGRLAASVRTMGLPEGQLVVYLVLFTRSGPMDSIEPGLHVELFRSEPVSDWRSQANPLLALQDGLLKAGYFETQRWPAVAAAAAAQADQFLQP